MDEMTTFERQIADELGQMGGPGRRIDAMAMARSVATPASRWPTFTRRLRGHTSLAPATREFTMSSAVKFVAAAAIVALFGGFLLMGVLTTQQGDEMAPAAVTESPSPMTTEELLSGMVTEEVEPGVFRVINDGVRDLAHPVRGYPSATVDLTSDGNVWLSGGGEGGGAHGLFRLGEEATFEDPSRFPPYLEVAPDGSLWAIAWDSDDRDVILSFDGEGWTERTTTTDGKTELGSLAVGPDGTVWATDHVGMVLLRLEDDGTLTTSEYWADVYDGVVSPDELAVSPDGDVWLVGMVRWDGPEAEALLRYDGKRWEVIPGPEGLLNHTLGNSLAIGPDGTLWVNTNHPEDGWPEDGDWRVGGLARFDDPGWTIFTEADGVEDWGGQGFISTDLLSVAPDGSLWMNGIDDISGCDGVDHYDGRTWTSYLRKACVHDLAIAPDGSVWVRADVEDVPWNADAYDVGLYVIAPGAALATRMGAPPEVEEPTDAAGTWSPTEELLAGMVTEEVEPGVYRVINDGYRDLTHLGEPGGLVTGPDGSVWVVREDRLHRLGSSGIHDDGVSPCWPIEVAPDGSLWSANIESLARFDGETWTEHATGIHDRLRYVGIAIGPDGAAWTMESRIEQAEPVSFDERGSMARLQPWADVFHGNVAESPIAVSPDGDVWVAGELPGADDVLLRFDGDAWDVVPGPEGFVNEAGYGQVLDIGSDGSLWLGFHERSQHPGEGREGDGSVLARLDETGWTTFSEADGIQEWGSGHRFIYQLMLRVAPDGSVWVNAANADIEDPCAGAARFDGVTWSEYLDHICVDDLDIAPDGAVWLVGEDEETAYRGTGPTDIYVITPEAVE